MAGHSEAPVETFSIGFRHERFDELPFAREVAGRFGTSHHEHVVDPGMPHGYAQFEMFPASRTAIDRMIAFLTERLATD